MDCRCRRAAPRSRRRDISRPSACPAPSPNPTAERPYRAKQLSCKNDSLNDLPPFSWNLCGKRYDQLARHHLDPRRTIAANARNDPHTAGDFLDIDAGIAGLNGAHRSTSPNTMSSEPSTAETSASMWPLQRKSIADRCGKPGARILHL